MRPESTVLQTLAELIHCTVVTNMMGLIQSKFFGKSIDHFRITEIWPGDRIRRPEQPTENEVRRRSCDESV